MEKIVSDKLHLIAADLDHGTITIKEALEQLRLVHLASQNYIHRPEMLKNLSVFNLNIAKI